MARARFGCRAVATVSRIVKSPAPRPPPGKNSLWGAVPSLPAGINEDDSDQSCEGIRQIGAILHAKAVSATVVKPFGFATGDGEGSRCGIRTRIALQNPVAQVVVAIPWGHGPFAIPGQGGMLIGYARVSTQETREQSPEKRRRTPLTTFWAAETQLGEPPHCVRSRLRRMQAPQRSSETPRLACKLAPICLIPLDDGEPLAAPVHDVSLSCLRNMGE